MLGIGALLLFLACVVLAYTRFFVGIVVAFLFPSLIGLVTWFVIRDPLLDTGDKAVGAMMFLTVVAIVEIGLFVGGLLRLI